MKKENINNYYTDEDLINFEKLKNFNDFKVNKLNNNQNKSHPVRYDMSDNKHFNKIMNINNDKSSLSKKTKKTKENNHYTSKDFDNFEKINLKVGLEIHQQLNTNKKLFCKCRPIESDEYTEKFSRSLRTAKSELGELDPAALFEKTKSKKINYYANSQSSCLVEKDEEPPHDLNHDAKKISLLISSMLESKIFSEIHVMRKTVIDGSNTTGFQRTMLVSQGGNLKVNGKNIGVQAVCLEEDAAKLLKDEQNERNYSLDRLGVPLVEIALEPVSTKPSGVKEIALTLGRLLRATRMVKRGIGSIRQDVNISVMNSGVVEVKGVQQLDHWKK